MELVNLPTLDLKKVRKKVFSPTGPKDKVTYKYVLDEKYGCPRRVVSGSYDLDDFIQEGRDSVDFNSLGKLLVDAKANIIDHFKSDGIEIDITGQPRNLHEANKLYNDLQKSFNGLPSELKALFDDSFDSFRTSYKAGTMATKIESYFKSIEEKETLATAEGGAE